MSDRFQSVSKTEKPANHAEVAALIERIGPDSVLECVQAYAAEQYDGMRSQLSNRTSDGEARIINGQTVQWMNIWLYMGWLLEKHRELTRHAGMTTAEIAAEEKQRKIDALNRQLAELEAND